jgi:UDPglucose 6-dehydrogenase
MKILVIGTGYVGLVTGACISETGVEVTCIDIDIQKIENLKKGIIPIYEPGLEDVVRRNVEKQRLQFSTSIKDSLDGCEAVFIAVGTPPGEDGSADISHVLKAAREIGQTMKEYLVIVTKSTVPIGTSMKVRDAVRTELSLRGSDLNFDIASNPEFLKEGNAVEDFLKPARIIIGVDNDNAKDILSRIYRPFQLSGYRTIFMDIPSAELTKYAANCMLATKISFMNEIANLCERVGADITMVRQGIGSDPRIGSKFIYAGAGYGGSCFPKDVKALIKTADDTGYSLEVVKAVEAVNNRQKEVLFEKISNYFDRQLKGRNFGIWGLSFKPNTDDIREAPSLVIIQKLLEAGATVCAYDPVAMKEAKHKLENTIKFAADSYDALVDADGLILITEWSEFRVLNFRVLEKLMKTRVIFDGRNIYDPQEVKENGFAYMGIGRKA